MSDNKKTSTSKKYGWTKDTFSNATKLYQKALNEGLTQTAALGLVGFIGGESFFDPNAVNPHSGAIGYTQWLGDRKKELIKRYGSNYSSDDSMQYLFDELMGRVPGMGWNFNKGHGKYNDKSKYYNASREEFLHADTLEDAIYSVNRGFGRPGLHELRDDARIKIAEQFAELAGIDISHLKRNHNSAELKIKYMDGGKGTTNNQSKVNTNQPTSVKSEPTINNNNSVKPNNSIQDYKFNNNVDPDARPTIDSVRNVYNPNPYMNNQMRKLTGVPTFGSNALYTTPKETDKHFIGTAMLITSLVGAAITAGSAVKGAIDAEKAAKDAEAQRSRDLAATNTANSQQAILADQQDMINRTGSNMMESFYKNGGKMKRGFGGVTTYPGTVWTEQYNPLYSRALGGLGQLSADFGVEQVPGGDVVDTSSDTEYIDGASHEEGGVQYDDQNELEGGEVVYKNGEDEDYIFSDAMPFGEKVSFAKVANQLAIQKGQLEEEYKALQEVLQMELKAVDGNENTATRGTHKRNAEKISSDAQLIAGQIAELEEKLQQLVGEQTNYGMQAGVYNEDGSPKDEYMRCGGRKRRDYGGSQNTQLYKQWLNNQVVKPDRRGYKGWLNQPGDIRANPVQIPNASGNDLRQRPVQIPNADVNTPATMVQLNNNAPTVKNNVIPKATNSNYGTPTVSYSFDNNDNTPTVTYELYDTPMSGGKMGINATTNNAWNHIPASVGVESDIDKLNGYVNNGNVQRVANNTKPASSTNNGGGGAGVPWASIATMGAQAISGVAQHFTNKSLIRQMEATRPLQQVNPTAPRLNADVRYTADKEEANNNFRNQERWLNNNVGNPQVRNAMLQQAQANKFRDMASIRQREFNDSRTIANQNAMLNYQNQVQNLQHNKDYSDQLSQFKLNMVGQRANAVQSDINNANTFLNNLNQTMDYNSNINMTLSKYMNSDGSLDPVGQELVRKLNRSGKYWGRIGGTKRLIGGTLKH